MSLPETRAENGRIELVDLARFAALVAMAVYHLAWDLEFFGYAPAGMTGQGGWRLFARVIASSFLFLAGASLVLAHGRGIRWPSFWKRWLQIAAAALLVSVATFFATPASFVFFGILHEIAFASLVGVAFVRLPFWATGLAAAAAVALPAFLAFPELDPRALAWIGLFETPPLSNDFVPVFPWIGAVLAGIAFGRLATDLGLWDCLRALNPAIRRLSPLPAIGRRSLLVYLVHQPVLLGLVWLATQVSPPDLTARFGEDCRRQCLATQDASVCQVYCGCAERELLARNLMDALRRGPADEGEAGGVVDVVRLCSAEALDPL